MKSQDSKFDWFKGLDASFMASLLVLGTTTAADARHDGVPNQLHLVNSTANRAERHEARAQRRDFMLENRALRNNTASPVPTAATVGLGSQPTIRNTAGSHHAHRNTAVLFPGQVSTFHTARPNQGGSTYVNDGGRTRTVTHGVSLDLSSTHANITVGENLFDGNTTIQVGGQTRVLSAGSKVTAAEYAALNQKLATGTQALTLSSKGAAEGGSLNLNLVSDDGATIHASELVIPKNVSVTGDFARTADGVRVTQDVVNYGSLLATSSNENRNTAVIAARDINNEQGGSIASQASTSNPELNLALRADRDLNNLGTITSAGELELSAGRSVTNGAGSVAAANGHVLVTAPVINNQGVVSSVNGDISLDAPIDSAMHVNNYGGALNAASGAINIRNADFAGTADTTVFGGNLSSSEVNINAGQGTADLTANEVTGVVSTKGLAAHVSTNTSDLVLGEQCLTGDPTYYNTGNIILGGNVIVAEKLAIIAGGNITTNQNNLTVRARNGANLGFDINIIAGANVVAGSGETPGTLPTQPPISGNTTGLVSFSGASATGGNIDLSTVTGFSIIDASGSAGQNAGNITMAAFAELAGTRGKILLNNNWELNANGNGASNNGSISVIAGSKSGTAIVVDDIQNFNGTGATANISVINAQPTLSSGATITFNTAGSITTGNTIVASSTIAGGTVSTGLVRSRGSVTITSGGNAVVGEIQAGLGALVKVQSLGTLNLNDISSLVGNPNTALRSQVTATGDILMRGRIRTDGGILMVSGGDIVTGTGGVNSPGFLSNPDGNAGNIAVIAGANFQVNPTNVTVTGASGTGGDLQFTAGNTITEIRASSNLNGNGGKINLIAFDGVITLPSAPVPFSVRADSNGGTFTNGNIDIIAGANAANAIVMGGAQTDGSNNNTGDINILAQDPNSAAVVLSTAAGFAGISSGTFLGGTSNPLSGVNITRQVATNGGTVVFGAGSGGVQFADIARFGHFEVNSLGDITNHGTGDASVSGAGEQANTLLWMATGNISFAGRINLHSSGGTPPAVDGGGGVVIVAGGTVQSIINDLGGFSESAIETNSGQDGGNIAVVAGASFTKVGDNLTINGASGSGGSILFDGTAVGGFTGEVITHVDAHSQGGVDQFHLDGGDITLISYNDIKLNTGTSTFFSAAGSSFNVPPPVFGSNGNVVVIAQGALAIPRIDMATNQGGSVLVRAATPSSATFDVAPNTLSAFGTVVSGTFGTGALSNTVLNFPTVFAGGAGSVSYSVASLGDITLGAINVSSTLLGVGGGSVNIQSGGEVVVGAVSASNTTASGDGGDITIISNSPTVFNVGGGGANGSGLLTANASGTVGDGGNVSITNTGSGGIVITNIPSTTVVNGDGAGLELDAGSGNLNITPIGSTITRNAAGANNDGGKISLSYGSLTGAAGVITLSADGTGTGDGGSLLVHNNGGAITVGAAAGQFVLSTAGTANGEIDLAASGALTVTGSLNTADFITLAGAGVTLNSAITTSDVRVSSTGTLTVAAAITADPITLICTGNIFLNANQTADGGILIVSGGNITTTTNLIIDGSSSTGDGGNVVVIAGAAFTDNGTSVTIDGASASGGNINFTTGGGSLNFVSTSTNFAGASSGDITMLAFASGAANGQIILTPAAIINASGGVASAASGRIVMLADATSGSAISIGGLSSSTGLPGTGSVTVSAATPIVAGAGPIQKADASYSGAFTAGPNTAGNITTGLITTTYGSPISVTGGGNVTTGNLTTSTTVTNANGGTVTLVTGSTGSLTVGTIAVNGFNTGNGGTVNITAGSGPLTIGAINANGGNTGVGGDGGSVTLTVNTAATFNSNPITANGGGTTGDGGSISVSNFGLGGITIDPADYSITAFGNGGNLTFFASNAGNVTPIVATAPLTMSANAGGAGFANGSISLEGLTLSVPGNVNFSATGGIAGTGSIALTFPNGVLTNGGSFTANSGGTFDANSIKTAGAANSGAITLTAFGDIGASPFAPDLSAFATGGNKNGGTIQVTSTTGSVRLTNIFTSGSGTGTAGTVTVLAGGGGIDFANIEAIGVAGVNINLTSTNGDIDAFGGVFSPLDTFTLNLLGGAPGNATIPGVSSVASLISTGGGTITYNGGSFPIVLNGLGSTQSFAGTTTDTGTGVSIGTTLNTTGTLTFNTPRFSTVNNITAASISVLSTGDLTVVGAAGSPLLTGTTPPAGPPGTLSTPPAIIFSTGGGSNLNLFSNMTFTGDVALNNSGGTTTSNAGSLFTGNNNIKLTTNTWVQNGNIVANKLIFSGATIANTIGAVDIPSNLNFQGRDLAIIALTDINLNGILIDTSSNTGDGGNITLLAGYKFDPPTAGQTPLTGTTSPFTFSATQTSSGSIIGTATLDTSAKGATGDGGTVTAIANGGSVSIGNMTLSSANGSAGDVLVVGSTGASPGNVVATGVTGGNVTLSVSTATVINGPSIVVQEGLVSGGSFTTGAARNVGNIFVGNINVSSNANVLLETHGDLNVLGTIVGKSIVLNGDDLGNVNFLAGINSITANTVAGGNGGFISVHANQIFVSGLNPLTLVATGTGIGGGGFIDVETVADLTAGPGGNVIVNASAPAGNGGKIHLSSAGNLTTLAGGINAAGVGAGAEISLIAGSDGTGTLTLTDTTYLGQANAQGANADGGVIVLDSPLMVFNSSSVGPLTLSANGQGTGSGGSVTFRNNDPTPTFISAPTKPPKPPVNFLFISAESGSGSGGDGGSIVVETGGNLTVDTASLTAAPQGANGNGASFSLTAGNVSGKAGSLVVIGNLDATGNGAGTDGLITLSADNKKAFTIGGTKTPKNGALGILSAAVSSVGNKQGGVSVLSTNALASADVILSAGGKGAIAAGSGVVITATNLLDLSTQAGSVGKKGLAVNAPTLNLNAFAGGSVNVSNSFLLGPVTLNEATASGSFTLTTTSQGLNVVDVTATNGSINLTAGGGILDVSGHVIATNGGLILSNSNLATGSILIGSTANVETAGKGGAVVLAIGAPPKKGTGPNTLAGFTVQTQGSALAFFGPNAATGVLSGGTVNVFAFNKNVIFNNLSTGGQTISVDNGAIIKADPPSRTAPHAVTFNSNLTDSIEITDPTSSALPQQTPTISFDSSLVGLSNANRIDSAAMTSGITLSNEVNAGSLNAISVVGANTGSTGTAASEDALISSDSTGLLNFATVSATVGDTVYATTNDSATKHDTAGGSSDLLVNAVFHSDREAGQQAFSLDNQTAVNLSAVDSQSNEKQASSTRHVLSEGNVVFAPFSDMIVETPHGTVSLAAGSIALVMQSDSGLAVYDLHDQSKNAVVVATKNKRMSLSPGRHVLVSSHTAHDFASVNPIELVQYRGINQSKLDNGWNVYTSEFSIPSACYAVKPLTTLMKSNHHEARGLAKRLMKTTAVLMTLSPDHGDFVQFFKRQMTAMN